MSCRLAFFILIFLGGVSVTPARSELSESVKTQLVRKKKDVKKSLIRLAKAAGVIAIPSFVIGEYMMYASFFKGLYQWATHGITASSYFSKVPSGALYCVTVTVRDFEATPRKTFHSHIPSHLIREVDDFLRHTIPVNRQLTRLVVESSISTKTGRKIALAPLYCLWNAKTGITHDLEKKFSLTGTTTADHVFETIKIFTIGSVLSSPLLLLAFAL